MFRVALALGFAAVLSTTTVGANDWPQWGGPSRDFRIERAPGAAPLSWPEGGPRELWRVPLGAGESTIVSDGERLFTAYLDGADEMLVAIDPASGRRLWQHRQPVNLWPDFWADQGRGPYVTPALVRDPLITVTIDGTVLCLSKARGEVLWTASAWSAWHKDPSKSGPAVVGYTPSPLVVGDLVIVVGGGRGRAVQAYRWADGSLEWSSQDSDPAYASPRLIDVHGATHLVVFAADGITGLDPRDGSRLWHHPHVTDYRVNASMPLWTKDVLFLSSAYGAGSRGLHIVKTGDGFQVEELWHNPRIQVHHSSVVEIGGIVVGSSGDFGPAFVFGVDPRTGEQLFFERGFAKANVVASGERAVLLDESGELALIEVGRRGFEVLGRREIFETRSWAAPTLLGSALYARDGREMVALDFAAPAS
jgi:outer membrane protein assembly factor BamB